MKKDFVKDLLTANYQFRRNKNIIEYKPINDTSEGWLAVHYPNLWRFCAYRIDVAPTTVKSVINSLV